MANKRKASETKISASPVENPLIRSAFDERDLELRKPVVFRASFNRFEHINLTQAWSLWVTACHDDSRFGINPNAGWFLTLSLAAGMTLIGLQQIFIGIP